jgi:hypothetical protein
VPWPLSPGANNSDACSPSKPKRSQEEPTLPGSDRKRRRGGDDSEPESESDSRSTKRRSLRRNCKLSDAPPESSTRSTRRNPNPAFS